MNLKQYRLQEKSLTCIEVNELVTFLSKKCSQKTKNRLYSVLTYYFLSSPNAWYWERLEIKEGIVSYTAGQDYSSELTQIRNSIKGN